MRNLNFMNRIKTAAKKFVDLFKSKSKKQSEATLSKKIHNESGGMNKQRGVQLIGHTKTLAQKKKAKRRMQKISRLNNR